MLFDFETVGLFHLFDEGVEIFAGDFFDFFALTTDERVVALGVTFFHFAANVAFDAVDFVDEVEFFEDLNNAVNGDGVEIDFVLLEGVFGDFVR